MSSGVYGPHQGVHKIRTRFRAKLESIGVVGLRSFGLLGVWGLGACTATLVLNHEARRAEAERVPHGAVPQKLYRACLNPSNRACLKEINGKSQW